MMQQVDQGLRSKQFPIVFICLLVSLVSLSACVSRYQPLDRIRPLSGSCDDYAKFSVSIIKQRDQGFSKRASINIAAFSVGSEENRELLYTEYKPIFEIVYADYQIRPVGIRAAGRVLCDHQLTLSWLPLLNENYKNVAEVVRLCQDANDAEVDMAQCILARARGKPDPELEKPPV
jgi:hypothetical protein